MTINQFMTKDHRDCDEQFAQLENIVDQENFENAKVMFDDFYSHMLKHFDMEEQVMFPKYEACEGGHCNPTPVMLMEHNQMRGIFAEMKTAIESNDKERFLGQSEALLFTMQQHNMKEEQMMYNLADQSLNSEEIIKEMKAL
ncbi:hemerythrin domain-containing protein [Arcobacteraceae bacterium]|jgi:hemerythrin-like domain-containing protein|nr:hemerythrin domain-containing protein [Arcobacteraceae bacterium]